MKAVAFVIVSYNSEKYIRKCLQSILELTTKCRVSVVVVDNDSTDSSLSIAQEFQAVKTVKLDRNMGFGCANNAGCNLVDADYYFIFNVDAYFEGDFDLDRMIDVMEEHADVAISSARLCYPDGSSQTSSFTYSTPSKWVKQVVPAYSFVKQVVLKSSFLSACIGKFSSQARSYIENHQPVAPDYTIKDVEWVSGAAMLVCADYIKKFGLFDEKIFLYGEDEDLCIVAQSHNYRVVQQNTHAIVHVHGWNSSGKFNPVVARYKEMSLRYFINKHFRTAFKRWVMLFLLPLYVRGWKNLGSR